jgi:hypothetical protein
MSTTYKQEVQSLWSSLSTSQQKKVISVLRALQYPDDPEILLDEFQAYYYTESPRFFGIQLPPQPQQRSSDKKKSHTAKRK